jgi:hypothetical protein
MKNSFLFIVFLLSCGAKLQETNKRPLFEVLTQQSWRGNIHFYEILTEPNEIKMLQNDS